MKNKATLGIWWKSVWKLPCHLSYRREEGILPSGSSDFRGEQKKPGKKNLLLLSSVLFSLRMF